MKRRTLLCFLALTAAGSAFAADALRVVPLGGPVTETVYALGAGPLVVGTDTSSVYPAAATKVPQVGYQRSLTAEGILSLKPDLVLATDEAGPANVIAQLRATGVRVVLIPNEHSVPGAQSKVRAIGAALDRAEAGEKLAATIAHEAEKARVQIEKMPAHPATLFLYARGGATMNVSGRGTAADAMIALAGARNAVTEYDGYKPLTAEAAVAAAPQFILTLDRGLESVGGKERLLTQPGLALTPAGQTKRIVSLDDLFLLGFGPRTGAAILELARALHPDESRR